MPKLPLPSSLILTSFSSSPFSFRFTTTTSTTIQKPPNHIKTFTNFHSWQKKKIQILNRNHNHNNSLSIDFLHLKEKRNNSLQFLSFLLFTPINNLIFFSHQFYFKQRKACRSLRLGETINQNPHFLNQNHHDDDEQVEHKETNKTTRTNRKERTR